MLPIHELTRFSDVLPDWVPPEAQRYLDHTEAGRPIRALARDVGCHASTILRQVRRIEARRDDPLVDEALRRLATQCAAGQKEKRTMTSVTDRPADESGLALAARDVLSALCGRGAVLAVSAKMEKAVVVLPPEARSPAPPPVERSLAEAMALTGWIACEAPGRVMRYRITPEGRAALRRFVAASENAARSRSEADDTEPPARARPRRARAVHQEPPLHLLARRKGRDGEPFLPPRLRVVGDRLHEDFVLSDLDPSATRDWQTAARDDGVSPGVRAARERLHGALHELGPGLGDIALRCCCLREGLETIERDLGWAQRSGKVVLRIALERLWRYYDENDLMSPLIG